MDALPTAQLPSPEELARKPARTKHLGTITRAMIGRFAISIGDPNPIYFDDGLARAAGWPGVVAPPGFLTAVLGWEAGPPEDGLQPDGSDPELVLPEVAGYRLMGGGQALSFGAPVQPGDEVTASKRVVDVQAGKSRSGAPMIFITAETEYHNQRHELLVRCRETLIALPPEPATP